MMTPAAGNRVIEPVIGVSPEAAGNFGVPYIGCVAALARGIQDSCEKAVVHRVSVGSTIYLSSLASCLAGTMQRTWQRSNISAEPLRGAICKD